jgi:hypothetical protein
VSEIDQSFDAGVDSLGIEQRISSGSTVRTSSKSRSGSAQRKEEGERISDLSRKARRGKAHAGRQGICLSVAGMAWHGTVWARSY